VAARLALPVIGLCLIVIGGVAYWIVFPQIRAEYHWRQAQKAIFNYELARAQEHLNQCIQVRPTDGEILFTMARTLRRAGKPDEARKYLHRAGQQHWVPNQIKLENLLIKAQLGYLSDVVPQLQALLEQGHLDDHLILEALVFGYSRTNFLTEANRWATVWIDQHPDDWLARYWHGLVLEMGNQFTLAKEEYEKALELNPDGFELHLRVAEVSMYTNQNLTEEILAHYEAALKSDPRNPIALLGMARCQQTLRSREDAKVTLARLLEEHPTFAPAFIFKAQLALDEDQKEEALEWFKKAHALDPSDRLATLKLMEVLRQLKRNAEADEVQRRMEDLEKQLHRLEEIRKEVLNHPKDVALRTEAGNSLLKLGKPQEAMNWFMSAYFIDPKDRPTKEGMKLCLQRMGDKDLADQYKQFLEDQP
jgi:tetratricopeptide (TPR) repeat protein